MGKLLRFPIHGQNKINITCPLCRRKQEFRQATDGIWFPVPPFCCEAMRLLDTPEWNALLDTIITAVLQAIEITNKRENDNVTCQ